MRGAGQPPPRSRMTQRWSRCASTLRGGGGGGGGGVCGNGGGCSPHFSHFYLFLIVHHS
jgi:hypothetical protein